MPISRRALQSRYSHLPHFQHSQCLTLHGSLSRIVPPFCLALWSVWLPMLAPSHTCSDYPVECGCGQTPSMCLVARGKHPAAFMYKQSGGVTGGVASDEDYHHK